jgi:uncharacterized small protein (DUF1192 family)
MSILMRKLFRKWQEEQTGEGGEGGGAATDEVTRAQELEASRHGWIPKHKYNGPENGWKDAATFLADGQRFNTRLKEEVASLKRELSEFKGTAKQFADFQQRQIEARDSQINDLVRDLKRQQREAIRNGDDDAADAIDDRIGILQDEHQKVKTDLEKTKQTPTDKSSVRAVDENGQTSDPVILQWISEGNQWFQENKHMREYCFSIANELMATGEHRRGRAFLDVLREKMEEAFPLKLGKKGDPTSRGNMTEAGGGGSGGGNAILSMTCLKPIES